MSDPAKYRTKEEVEEYKMRDPLERVRKTILDNNWATEADLEAAEEKVMVEVLASVEFSESSPYPEGSALWEDVYSEPNYPFITE
jgi:pyruvate dehydrogenase E1 component alpha subunit